MDFLRCKSSPSDYEAADFGDGDLENELDEEKASRGMRLFQGKNLSGPENCHPLPRLIRDKQARGIVGRTQNFVNNNGPLSDNKLRPIESYTGSLLTTLQQKQALEIPFPHFVAELDHNFTLTLTFQGRGTPISQLANSLNTGGNKHEPYVIKCDGPSIMKTLEGLVDKNMPHQLIPLKISLLAYSNNIPCDFFLQLVTTLPKKNSKSVTSGTRSWVQSAVIPNKKYDRTGFFLPRANENTYQIGQLMRTPLFTADLDKVGMDEYLRWAAVDAQKFRAGVLNNSVEHPTHFQLASPANNALEMSPSTYAVAKNAVNLYGTDENSMVSLPYPMIGDSVFGNPINLPKEGVDLLFSEFDRVRDADNTQMNVADGISLQLIPASENGWEDVSREIAAKFTAPSASTLASFLDPSAEVSVMISLCVVPIWSHSKHKAREAHPGYM